MEQNHQAMNARETVEDYEKREYLFAAEEKFLAQYASRIAEARVLDLGVGAGRTTRHLLPRSRSYRAIDYAPAMIEACRRKFPECGPEVFGLGDARDLSAEPEQGYDLVLFSYNGLDMVDHSDRLRVLWEVRRVLSPNGLFFFSAHSLHAFPFADEKIQARNQDVDLNLLRKRGRAILRDAREDCITYYIYPETQRKQLWRTGFKVLDILDLEGMAFNLSKPAKDWMLHYVCRPRRSIWQRLLRTVANREKSTDRKATSV
jgi:SAM-dependent methyltransferase